MKKTTFSTAQDCEAAFYEALEACDLEAMMEVWAEDEDVVCIHPGGPRLVGYELVRDSWVQIFASGQRLRFHLTDQSRITTMMLSIHSMHENLMLQGDERTRHTVACTNVFVRGASGWRMVVHHASQLPEAPRSVQSEPEPPKVIH
jgi:ketosteroid isomerase-like protein